MAFEFRDCYEVIQPTSLSIMYIYLLKSSYPWHPVQFFCRWKSSLNNIDIDKTWDAILIAPLTLWQTTNKRAKVGKTVAPHHALLVFSYDQSTPGSCPWPKHVARRDSVEALVTVKWASKPVICQSQSPGCRGRWHDVMTIALPILST